jgi:hypothetical protein
VALSLLAAVASSQILSSRFTPDQAMQSWMDGFSSPEWPPARNNLSCSVIPIKAQLDFDFSFHSGYNVKIPRHELAGDGNELTVLFRIFPKDRKEEATYMSQGIRVPAMDDDVGGVGGFQGAFAIGEGKYHVDWVMRDRKSRLCTAAWDIEAKLNKKEGYLRSWIDLKSVRPLDRTLFRDEPQVRRAPDPLKVHIIVNFAPQNPNSSILEPRDLQGLVGILRRIARDPLIGEYSIVAFSLQTQEIVYRKENTQWIDFRGIGEALNDLHLGVVSASQLSTSKRPAEFIANLINQESNRGDADALIIVGPKPDWSVHMPADVASGIANAGVPIFYFNYDVKPEINPWRDLIGRVVKQHHGIEYTITGPRDLFAAWSDAMAHISHSDNGSPPRTQPAKNAFRP